jgi:osmotically-inducible protein OsmY
MSRSFRPLAIALVTLLPLAAGCDRLRSASAGDAGESTRALALRVRLELLQKLGVDGLRVEVDAQEGKVHLGGRVKKRATAELAEEVARTVDGVGSVSNDIRVEGAESPTTPGQKVDAALGEAERELADAALETRARLALVDRLGSDGFRIGTDAASGVLTLEFPREMERDRRQDAIETAKKVQGVVKVVPLDKD